MPHIEERTTKRGKGEERGRGKRKPQKKKFPAGRKSVVKQKKDSDISRDSGIAACRAEEDRICIIREKRDVQKEDRRRVQRRGW